MGDREQLLLGRVGTFSQRSFKVLNWLHENGGPWGPMECQVVAEGGCLQTLKWMREKGCPWGLAALEGAAANGNLQTLKWIWENGYPRGIWNEQSCFEVAAKGGHLQVLKWLVETCRLKPTTNTCYEAMAGGHFEVVLWHCRMDVRQMRPSQNGFVNLVLMANNKHLDLEFIMTYLHKLHTKYKKHVSVKQQRIKLIVIALLLLAILLRLFIIALVSSARLHHNSSSRDFLSELLLLLMLKCLLSSLWLL